MKTKIINARVITPVRELEGWELAYEGTKITEIAPHIEGCDQIIDGKGCYLTPGFIDRHVHGGWGFNFASGNVDEILFGAWEHAKLGATSMCPTTFLSFSPDEALLQRVDALQEGVEACKEGPELLGIHFEGPFGHKKEYPIDMNPDNYKRLLDRYPRALVWTVDPEVEGAQEFIQELNRRGIIASLGHSENCTHEKFMLSIENGARHVTHIYSSMSGVYREDYRRMPGAVETALMEKGIYVEVLADDCHLSAQLCRFIYQCRGAFGMFLSTDCHPQNRMYIPGEPKIVIAPDPVGRMAWYGAAGMDEIVRVMYRKAGIPLKDVITMACRTPAEALGVSRRKGVLAPGYDADLLLFDEDVRMHFVAARGRTVLNEL